MKIHLITYGDEIYADQKEFFRETALASSFFDEITLYGPEFLDEGFLAQFHSIINHQKGGGYWIWKPYLVNNVFASIPKDDILIYCDTGCMINIAGKEYMDKYISLLMDSNLGSIAFELPHQEIEYTKQEVFNYFDSPASIINSAQLVGGILLLKKCNHARLLVDEWYETLFRNPLLFAEDKNLLIQHPTFKAHRHDQSIFSVIRKSRGTEIIQDQTYFNDFIREGKDYPIWATRLR